MRQISVSIFPGTGEVAELKTKPGKGNRPDLFPAVGRKVGEDPAVSFKDVVYVFHMNIFASVNFIMPRGATLVVTEFFVGPAGDALATLCAMAVDLKIGHNSVLFTIPIIISGCRLPAVNQENQTH